MKSNKEKWNNVESLQCSLSLGTINKHSLWSYKQTLIDSKCILIRYFAKFRLIHQSTSFILSRDDFNPMKIYLNLIKYSENRDTNEKRKAKNAENGWSGLKKNERKKRQVERTSVKSRGHWVDVCCYWGWNFLKFIPLSRNFTCWSTVCTSFKMK